MKYSDGHAAEIGDLVEISDAVVGKVVVLVKEGIASEGFFPNEWAYLKEGILVETRDAGLIHYPETFNNHLVLTSRADAKPQADGRPKS